MTYVVELIHNGNAFYLRSTVWTSEITRATRHETVDQAKAAIEAARKFHKVSVMKKAEVVRAPSTGA